MTIYPTPRKRWLYRGLSLGGAIAVMIAGALAATVDSYSAAKQQRLAAARALHDYAVFASYTYSQNAYSAAHDRAFSAYAGLAGLSPRSLEQLPPETIVLPPISACSGAAKRERHRFRLDLPSRVLHVSRSDEGGIGLWQQLDHLGTLQQTTPVSMEPRLEARIRDTLEYMASTPAVRQAGWGYAYVRDGDTRESLSLHPVYAASGAPMAVYAYEACIDRGEFAKLYRDVQPLPPTLISFLPRDSLLFLRVTDPDGTVLYTNGTGALPTAYTGATSVPLLAGLNFTVSIRSALSAQVLNGATSRWGMQRALLLLLLTVGLAGIALVLFRREARFVQTREDFVTGVSHELRTPLQQILMFVQLLRLQRLNSEEERARSLAIIETEAQRLIGLVGNILDRARPESAAPRMRAVDVHELLHNSILLFKPLAATRHVTIRLSGDNAIVVVDPEALHQVLTSLLDNAVKYGPAAQTVDVRTELLPGWIAIHVDDQGMGIPVQDRERAWEPFVRLEGPGSRSNGGVGIGLAIVRTAVERMSGTIVIDDAPGGGARLTLRLPHSNGDATLASPVSNPNQ